MAIPLLYNTGTITIAANATTVTGVGTAWAGIVRRGSILQAGTSFAIVTSDPDIATDLPTNTTFNISRPWGGGALTAQPYQLVVYQGGAEFAEAFTDLVARLGGTGTNRVAAVAPLVTDGVNNDLWYNTLTDTLYLKTAGAWVAIKGGGFSLKVASYTLVLADQNDTIGINVATPATLTIPTNATVAFPIGTVVDVVQYGASPITVTPAAGVTLQSHSGNFQTIGQGGAVRLIKTATDIWSLSGDILPTNVALKTASYTLVLADQGDTIQMSVATANTLTVPLNATAPFPAGARVDVVQYGVGATTITPAAGVTIRSEGGQLRTLGQYAVAILRKIGTDEWVLAGKVLDASINSVVASYTLALSDANDTVQINVAAANILTVPTNAAVPFAIGTVVDIIQYGAGGTTLTPAAGVTIRATGGKFQPVTQYAEVRLRKIGTDEWVLSGKYFDSDVIAKTASYTLALVDQGNILEMNVATANTLTVPLNSAVAFPVGTKIDVLQYGAGITTIAPAAGVTIRGEGALQTLAQYALVTLTKIATDEWLLSGKFLESAVLLKTASYTLIISDPNNLIQMSVATANTLTVPTNATVPYNVGTLIEVMQYGIGTTTITAAAGVTIRSESGRLRTAAQYSIVRLQKIGTDEWILTGDLKTEVVAKTASYTLTMPDQDNFVQMNVAGANTLTIPLNSAVPYPVGTTITLEQHGAGIVTITPTAGVTLRSSGAKYRTATQFAVATLTKIGTDEWVATGDLIV